MVSNAHMLTKCSRAHVTDHKTDIIPIPGTKRVKYLEDNAAAVNVHLSKDEEAKIRKAVESVGGAKGTRQPPALLAQCFADSPELE